jgi:hypothetical protein
MRGPGVFVKPLSLFQNRLFCHRLLQFFGAAILWIAQPAKLRIFKETVPKTEVLEQPPLAAGYSETSVSE